VKAARKGEVRNAYRISAQKSLEKYPLGTKKNRTKLNNKTDLKEVQ
jgi:hypothetical protein